MEFKPVMRYEMQEVSDFLRPIFLETYDGKVTNSPQSVINIFEHWDTLEPLLRKFDSGVRYYVVRESGKIVALVALKGEEDGVMYLDKLYVSPSMQGKGLGSRGMEFAMDTARKEGYDLITTHSNAANIRAIRHYGRFGLEVVATVHRCHDGGEYDYAYLVGKL